MSACDTQQFSNVSESAWECMLRKAESNGIPIENGHSGSASKGGFSVTWTYDPEGRTLSLQCTESPWWAPCDMINSKIRELVNECL